MKEKCFVLDVGRVEGTQWSIACFVRLTGGFHNLGRIGFLDVQQVNQRRKNSLSERRIRKNRYNRRQRDMGFVPICPMPEKGDFVWHHIDKDRVVPVVKLVHQSVPHSCGDGKLEGVLG